MFAFGARGSCFAKGARNAGKRAERTGRAAHKGEFGVSAEACRLKGLLRITSSCFDSQAARIRQGTRSLSRSKLRF